MITPNELIDLHCLEPTPTDDRTSVALLSIHKTATSYFSHSVLKQLSGMVKIDYQTCHYKNGDKYAPIVNPRGYIYGVLRIYDDDHPGRILTDSVIKSVQENELDVVILIRDPRDVIVSMYYSFGFSHGLSPDESTRQYQLRRRQKIQSMSIDEYAVFILPPLRDKLRTLIRIGNQMDRLTILPYDEMILDFKSFFARVQRAMPVNSSFESKMYADTRPKLVENIDSHRRSGEVGGHEKKLSKETISRINDELRTELEYFDYA